MTVRVEFPEKSRETNRALARTMRASGEVPAQIHRVADTGTHDDDAVRYVVWTERMVYGRSIAGPWIALPTLFPSGAAELEVSR